MESLKFSGLGTHWQILVDGHKISPTLEKEILAEASAFEQQFSRFVDESEVSQINRRGAGKYPVSDELKTILSFGLELMEKSAGAFNPGVANILSAYGYDNKLQLKPNASLKPVKGGISYSDNKLILTGKAQLDLGGWGKGYLIDRLYELLLANQQPYFLIDGGGDFRGTTKRSGQAWRIALEHPGDEQLALGVVELKNGALANSGISHRRAGNFHHLIDYKAARPARTFLSSHVLAPTATIADGLATALFVSPPLIRQKLARSYPIEFLLIDQYLQAQRSNNFQQCFS